MELFVLDDFQSWVKMWQKSEDMYSYMKKKSGYLL